MLLRRSGPLRLHAPTSLCNSAAGGGKWPRHPQSIPSSHLSFLGRIGGHRVLVFHSHPRHRLTTKAAAMRILVTLTTPQNPHGTSAKGMTLKFIPHAPNTDPYPA